LRLCSYARRAGCVANAWAKTTKSARLNFKGAAPRDIGVDPRLLVALRRLPSSEQKIVRRMLEGVAEKSRYDIEADTPKPAQAKRKRTKFSGRWRE